MKKLILFALMIFCFKTSSAQNSENPWAIGIRAHAIDFYAANNILEDFFKSEHWNVQPAFSRLTVDRRLSRVFTLGLDYSAGNFTWDRAGDQARWDFHRAMLGMKLRPLGDNRKIEPYVLVGAGAQHLIETVYPNIHGGLGLNVWIAPELALNAESNMNMMLGRDDYANFWQHSLGITVRLGKGKDSDGDGITDSNDECPTIAGPVGLKGCPDSDGDGIKDTEDNCPTVAGMLIFLGCPDTDNDGIEDSKDACPKEAGLREANGCPDSDGDGLVDNQDKCPKEPGSFDLNGCPDSDRDGIADSKDSCPDKAGKKEFNGCPDTDADGIEDSKDACPNEKGLKSTSGCPDADGDGIADKEDRCIYEAGVRSNNGCPAIKQEVINKLNSYAKAIQFESGKDIIKSSSYDELNSVISIMKEYPATRFLVEGHTDNTGNANSNLDLSKRRAAAVVKYFSDKGISVDRLFSEGYGDTRPVADNSTADGKAQNRRVEILLIKE